MAALTGFDKVTSLCLWLLLVSVIIGNLTPETTAVSTAVSFCEEIVGLPFHPRAVDVDSEGNVFALSYDQDVWRSANNGISWSRVLDDGRNWTGTPAVTTRNWLTLFVDSHDYIFANVYSGVGTAWNLYRSTDDGQTWSISLTTKRSWHMDEASNGTLWFHTYTGPGWAAVYKSIDHGTTWSVFYNFTMVSEDLRTLAVNDFDDNEVWVATSRRVMYWNGSSWTTVHTDAASQSYISSIWFDSEYVYLGAEYLGGRKANWRYRHHGPIPVTVWDYDYYWDADKLTYVPDEHSFRGLRINDIMLFGIRSQLWGSWDGDRWVKIVDLGDSTASDIESISQRRPIYFIDKKAGRLYRLSVKKEDLVQLFYAQFLKYRGNIKNEENYLVECRIANGTNELDLTGAALKDVQAYIVGLSRKNYLNNSGFEDDRVPTSGWTISGDGTLSDSDDAYEGIHSLKIAKNESDKLDNGLWQSFIPVPEGTILVFSAWVKANVTLANKVIIGIRNQTSNQWAGYAGSATGIKTFNMTTSWKRLELRFAVNAPDVNLRAEFYALKGVSYELLIDAVQFEKKEVGILHQEAGANADSIQHLQYRPAPYFAGTQDTMNPSLTLAGQNVTHLGGLTNGTETPPTSLTGVLTGAVEVVTKIEGSGEAIVRITGTRILSITNSVLRERTSDGIYIGHYYDIPVLTTNITNIVALTNKEAEITNQSYTLNKLSLTIDSATGTISNALVYVGDRGEPASVLNVASWSYNSTTRIVSVNVTHTNSQEVSLYWREHTPPTSTISLSGVQGNKNWFTSNVTVTLAATDDISGVNKTEYSFDNATWLTYTTQFTVSAEGNTSLYYRSVDNDGNAEATKAQTIKIDRTTPSGSVRINNGNEYTSHTQALLFLTANDAPSGISQMRLSYNNFTWTPWETYMQYKTWMLTSKDGVKDVFVQFIDNAGMVSASYSDFIILDTTKPIANAGADIIADEDKLVTLDGSTSSDNFGIATYTWAFTDETTKTLSEEKATYTFCTPGIYEVHLNVTDCAGNWALDTVIVKVRDITAPIADAGEDRAVNAGTVVIFDAQGSSDNVEIVHYDWDFGDGTIAIGIAVDHRYESPGKFNVTLTVSDSAGNIATHSITITVLDVPPDSVAGAFSLWAMGAVALATGIITAVAAYVLRRKR